MTIVLQFHLTYEISKHKRENCSLLLILLLSLDLWNTGFMRTTLIKTLRMCDWIFIQIYDRIPCIIQSRRVIITDSSFIQFFQQPDEAQPTLHTILYSTNPPVTLPQSSCSQSSANSLQFSSLSSQLLLSQY